MANYQAGFNSKVRVNNVLYTTQTWNVSAENPEQDVTNTEGIPGNPSLPGNTGIGPTTANASYIPAITRGRATVNNATFDLLENPFALPRNVVAGKFIALSIFPNLGISAWVFPSFLVTNSSQQGDARTLQPVTFQGVGDGGFQYPGNPGLP